MGNSEENVLSKSKFKSINFWSTRPPKQLYYMQESPGDNSHIYGRTDTYYNTVIILIVLWRDSSFCWRQQHQILKLWLLGDISFIPFEPVSEKKLKILQIYPYLGYQMSSLRLSANLYRLSKKEAMRLCLFLTRIILQT